MGLNHNSKTCHNKTLGNKTEATKDNHGGNLANKPTTEWLCTPAVKLSNNIKLLNRLLSTYTPDCAHIFLKTNTAFLDSTASLSHQDAPAVLATNELWPKMLTIPNGQMIATTKTLCLQLNDLSQKATLLIASQTYTTMCWLLQSCVM